MAEENVYRRLQRHLDQMPVAYPATRSGVELRLLEHLFTPDEAAMALHLSALPEPVEKIHRRAGKAGIGLAELREGLHNLAEKGAIIRKKVEGEPSYSKAMLAIGMYEFQAGRITKDYHSDLRQYMDEGFAEAILTKKTSQLRPIPINEEVLPERRIGTYDGAKALVMNSEGPFAVIPCVCRDGMDLEGEPCQQTEIRETCLLMGNFAGEMARTGVGRELSRVEMLGMLDQAREAGMVLQPQNTQDPRFICCCCGCCCAVLATAKKLPKPAEYFDANYHAGIDKELCGECHCCGSRCEMDAIIHADGPSTVDLHRCIGCGQCVSACPLGAIRLYKKAGVKPPPKTQEELYMKIATERFGYMGMAKIVAKKSLGMKI